MKVRIRNDSVFISGYVNAVGRDSKVLLDDDGSEFVEQIAPGTFANALRSATEPVKALRNHDPSLYLGDTETNLRLTEDSIGLYAELETSDAATVEKARAKKLRGWSFGFIRLNYEREITFAGKDRRIVNEIDLKEVSLLDDEKYPAYTGTSVNARELQLRAVDTDFEYDEAEETRQQAPDYTTLKRAMEQVYG